MSCVTLNWKFRLILLLILIISEAGFGLEQGFRIPPDSAQCWVYWWWPNGYVTKDSILRDLDEMKRQGISGALVFHAYGGPTPQTMDFLSPVWREQFKYAVELADERNITISLNLCAGWNAGGPWVKEENAAKMMVYSVKRIIGGKTFSDILSKPTKDKTYRDIFVLAWKLESDRSAQKNDICIRNTCTDLTAKMGPEGKLLWDVPPGQWAIVRFGYFLDSKSHAVTKLTGSGTYWDKEPFAAKTKIAGMRYWGPSYWEIDPLDANAMELHFEQTAGVVLQDVHEYAGSTFKYVHIDSGEIGTTDWTATFLNDFWSLRGYDALQYMAAKADLIVDNFETTRRFLEDYDQTVSDLMITRYYGRLNELAHRRGLGTHCESGGYQKPPVDALRALSSNDIVMSEFWSRKSQNYIHQLSKFQLYYHDGIKNASSAAHIYGIDIVQAESFTVMRNMNFDRDLFALKDIGDRAFCAGLNRNMLCFFISQPEEHTKPGYYWPGVGMEFDRHVTWWPMSRDWLTYLSRCQYLLQQGNYNADVCYYQGDWTPGYVPAKWAQNPPLPSGYDCDTINSEALLKHAKSDRNGRLVLPKEQSYRYLVLWQGGRWEKPPHKYFGRLAPDDEIPVYPQAGSGHPLALSPEVLMKIKKLVGDGVTLIGPRPNRSVGLTNYPDCDEQVSKLADELWGTEQSALGQHKYGRGRVIWGQKLSEIMAADNIPADLQIQEDEATLSLPRETLSGIPNTGSFDWIHRSIGQAEIFFIANLRNADARGEFTFRITGKQPELWDPVTGDIRDLNEFVIHKGRIKVHLVFAPRQSFFVVFKHPLRRQQNLNTLRDFPEYVTIQTVTGPWELSFDPQFGGPEKINFDQLQDWTTRDESGIKYYSGIATYRKQFDLMQPINDKRVYLDLGRIKNMASVTVNGKELGTVWCAPWRIDVTDAIQPKKNKLIIKVANLWINRLIGDVDMPLQNRYTKTNAVDKYRADTPLSASGLLGPVRLITQ